MAKNRSKLRQYRAKSGNISQRVDIPKRHTTLLRNRVGSVVLQTKESPLYSEVVEPIRSRIRSTTAPIKTVRSVAQNPFKSLTRQAFNELKRKV